MHYLNFVVSTSVIAIAIAADIDYLQSPDNTHQGNELNSIDDERQILRLGDLMLAYVERAEERFREVMGIKKATEEVSIDQRRAFETGYIMADLIEAKALVFTKKQMNPSRFIEADRIRYLTYVQNAYIKIYHLTHMMHEIEPKFGTDNTGQITKLHLNAQLHDRSPEYYNTAGFYYSKDLDAIRDKRVKERNHKIKKEMDIHRLELEIHGTVKPGTIKTTTNWWPIAYGWDIEYYW